MTDGRTGPDVPHDPAVGLRVLLSAPEVGPAERAALLAAFDGGWIAPAGPDLAAEAREDEFSALFDAYEKERKAADRLHALGGLRLPAGFDYLGLRTLSMEARQKLTARRPETMAQAASLPGVTPSDLQNLVIELERRRRAGVAS
jgi:tRNA uridine 5-carboxymethylaminomethyl modification enzyme